MTDSPYCSLPRLTMHSHLSHVRLPTFCRNIAACYGIGKYDDDDQHNPGSLFIVQELVKGGNLLHKVYKQMLNRQKCVYTSQEALTWMVDVAHGMQYLHAVTENKPMIIHRDLKLENIMLSPDAGGELPRQHAH